MELQNLEHHQKAQCIAKRTMKYLKGCIREGMSEAEIAEEARRHMEGMGASFWYYGKPAIVLVNDRTRLSVSGKDYAPTGKKVSRIDLVTIDLSPEIDGCWGDYARSLIIADGFVRDGVYPNNHGIRKDLADGIGVENGLHEWVMKRVKSKPETTFGELYSGARKQAELLGYKILDFRGNVGHTIEKELEARVFAEEGSNLRVLDTGLFTFEPHIGKGNYGFKREDIYYFLEGKLWRL